MVVVAQKTIRVSIRNRTLLTSLVALITQPEGAKLSDPRVAMPRR
jgi:hypothetical protein